jgi:hypothetical protein
MAKRVSIEDQLAVLRRLRAEDSSPQGLAELEQILRAPRAHGLVIKGAAELAHRWEARALIPALAAAAEVLAPEAMGNQAAKRDPGCEAKEAILRALVDWEADLSELYVKAAAWHQYTPVMNGQKEVAAECRGLAALGIAQTRHALGPEMAMSRLVDLLADDEAATRVRAAQALGMWPGPEAPPVLRLKAHLGDDEPQVLGEILAALLRHDPRAHLDFVAAFLDRTDSATVEATALALGESRQIAALPALTAAYERFARESIRTSLLMAIALLRHEDSLAWFLARLPAARPPAAVEMLQALRLYKGDDKAVPKIAAVARLRPELSREFEAIFT